MKFSPTQNNPRVSWIFAALIVFGGITYAIPIVCEANKIYIAPLPFTALTLVSVVAALFVLIKYKMTSFTYVVRLRDDVADGDGDGLEKAYSAYEDITRLSPDLLDFCVFKASGSRLAAMECLMSLSDLVSVTEVYRSGGDGRLTRADVRAKYAKHDNFVYYDYTLTLGLDPALELVFIDGQRYIGIIIEPDEVMRAYFLSLKNGRNTDE